MNILLAYMYVAIVLDHAHLACPIALAWGDRGFRHSMLVEWDKFILLPALCVLIPFSIGLASNSTKEPVFQLLVGVHFVWNTWHFAAQNYGICALSGGSVRQRNAAFIVTVICLLALPILWANVLWVVLADLGISLIHWVMDIRLSGYVAQRVWLFAGVVLAVGMAGFIWKGVATGVPLCGPTLVACKVSRSIPALVGLRFGLGFWHFLMSRWVWSSKGRALLLA